MVVQLETRAPSAAGLPGDLTEALALVGKLRSDDELRELFAAVLKGA